MNDKLSLFISEEKIQQRIRELAKQIDDDHQGKQVVAVMLLTGALFFGIDLIKQLKSDVLIDTLSISSYSGSESTGVIKINSDLKNDICGKDVLIIEDIVDTGLTLENLKSFIMHKKPNSFKLVSLLDKKDRRIANDVTPDYTGFVIENLFVVGYGLDFNEKFRNLRDIYIYIGDV